MQTFTLNGPNVPPGGTVPGVEALVEAERLPEITNLYQADLPSAASVPPNLQRMRIPGDDLFAATGLGREKKSHFGVFYALRAVFVIYLGIGMAAAFGYEIWTLLTR